MLAGVAIVDPSSTWIEPEREDRARRRILPFTVLRGSTTVAATGAEIGPHVVAIDAEIGQEATVGPFCYLRPGTVLGPRSKAGAFVEIKKSTIGQDTKVPHLSYIGDAEIGEGTNIGAGSITANFPHQPRPAQGQDHDRQQRPRSSGHYVRCSGHCWRRCVDGGGPSSPTTSRPMPSQASRPGKSTRKGEVESGTIEQTLPGLEGTGVAGTQLAIGRALSLTPKKRLAVVAGSSHPELADQDRRAPRRRADEGRARDLRRRLALLPLRGLGPRCGHVHRPDRRRLRSASISSSS